MKRLRSILWFVLFFPAFVFALSEPVTIILTKYIAPPPIETGCSSRESFDNYVKLNTPTLSSVLDAVWGAGVEYEILEVNASGDCEVGGPPDYNVSFCRSTDNCNRHIHRESLSKVIEEDEDFIIHTFYITIEDYYFSCQEDDNTTEDPTVDINHDDMKDACEYNVATPQGGDYLIGVATDETNKLYHVVKDETPKIVTTQNGEQIELPYGTVSFDINVSNAGDSATVHIYYPYNPDITGYAKEINGNWVKVDSTVQHDQAHNQTIVSFTLTDGGALDDDGIANKVIKDPGGGYIGQGQPQTSVTVPLSPLALGFLIALFGFAGSRRIQRR
ncbi:choice-of-anchor U domain-containing protein [Nitratiruptor tergarcus]|uniref:Uncharacterized protein n=1 Tax=Nitratiruptor tergarcus DSM 16512 TaxID=1069081 RepID=A0A1W1WR34_9BACT|nr:choice-of-anchor U domain-containing protein [Nitratiruptor tergarcus]SMC08669.1 hypothetical protein SAMN05660197_0433 [Nitratiruptor tergarcus DSM 16512]